jgi:hypothetical protein
MDMHSVEAKLAVPSPVIPLTENSTFKPAFLLHWCMTGEMLAVSCGDGSTDPERKTLDKDENSGTVLNPGKN